MSTEILSLCDAAATFRATDAAHYCFHGPTALDAFVAACERLMTEAAQRRRYDLHSNISQFKEGILALCRDRADVAHLLPPLRNLALAAVHQLEQLAPRQRRQCRRASNRPPRPLTDKEAEAMYLIGEHKGNFTAAAAAAGKSRPVMKRLYDKAMAKLAKAGVRKPRTQALPLDQRGQVNL